MKIHSLFLSLIGFLFFACNGDAQTTAQPQNAKQTTSIQVIQFHSEHRCVTCNKIEALSRETLKSYPSISFSLVNVEEAKNEKLAEKFEATGTALFLYNSATGKKIDLTDFAFMNAGNKEKFMAGLKREIDLFLKM